MKPPKAEARAVGAASGFSNRRLYSHNDNHPPQEIQALDGIVPPEIAAAWGVPARRGGWQQAGNVAMQVVNRIARQTGRPLPFPESL
jgi:hypothetical protein